MNTKPIGRRPGNSDLTKHSILAAARKEFGDMGFERATIRAIARAAGVDPALIIHYFKNKRQLFVEAHQLPFDPSELFAAVAQLPIEQRAKALTTAYFEAFTRPGSPALSMLRAAATNDAAATMLQEFISNAFIEHSAKIIEGPNPALRAALIGSHLIGILFARELLGIEELRKTEITDLVATAAPVLQTYISGTTFNDVSDATNDDTKN